MRNIILIIFLGIICTPALSESNYSKDKFVAINCQLISSERDSTMEADLSKYKFSFFGIDKKKAPIEYSIDGVNYKARLTEKNALIIQVTPGKHIFEFLIKGYNEVFTNTLLIRPQFVDKYRINLTKADPVIRDTEFVSYKPIIYLYPEKELEVSVKIDIHGSEKFLYPTYKESWEFTASPNGDLTFGVKTYNYLFWEAKSNNSVLLEDVKSGFFVRGDNVVSFLEEKLSKANLTTEEQADFITFWGPKLIQNELNFIHFIFNETCNQYADLKIDPAPDNIYRIYMLWSNVEDESPIKEQEMESANRDGFTVIEWGGQEQ